MKIKNLIYFIVGMVVMLSSCQDSSQVVKPAPAQPEVYENASASSIFSYTEKPWRTFSIEKSDCEPPVGNCLPEDAEVNPDNEGDLVSLLHGTTGTQAAANLLDVYPIFAGTTELQAVSNGTLTIYVHDYSGKYFCFLATSNNIAQAVVILPTITE